MVTAGQKSKDHFWWGDAEQFHTVEQDDKQFRLFETVKITTNNGSTVEGEIGYISETSVDILPEHMSTQRVWFNDIKSISY